MEQDFSIHAPKSISVKSYYLALTSELNANSSKYLRKNIYLDLVF